MNEFLKSYVLSNFEIELIIYILGFYEGACRIRDIEMRCDKETINSICDRLINIMIARERQNGGDK